MFEGYTAVEESWSPAVPMALVAAAMVSPATFGTTTVGGAVVVVVGGVAAIRTYAAPPEYVPGAGSVPVTTSVGDSPETPGVNPSAVKIGMAWDSGFPTTFGIVAVGPKDGGTDGAPDAAPCTPHPPSTMAVTTAAALAASRSCPMCPP